MEQLVSSPDGKLLALACRQATTRLWDVSALEAHNRHPRGDRPGSREMTALRLFEESPLELSAVMRAAQDTGAVAFHRSEAHFAEIGFDGEQRGHRIDLQPDLRRVLCS